MADKLGHYRDVSDIQIAEKLNGLAREGVVIPVNRNLAPYDPAPGKTKTLKARVQLRWCSTRFRFNRR